MPLGEIDRVEVDAELGEAEEGGDEQALAADFEIVALPLRDGRHRKRCDNEAIGDRPLRRHRAELTADDDPGRAPDGGEDDEWDGDRAGTRLGLQLARCDPQMRLHSIDLTDDSAAQPINGSGAAISAAYAEHHNAASASARRSSASP